MTYIDFQIDAGRFLAAQRTYLRRLALCPPLLPAIAGVQVVVDRVDIGASSLRHDEPTTFDVFYVQRGEVVGEAGAAKGFKTVLAQQLTLQFTTDADIRSHPNADPPLIPWQVTVLYELSADAVFEDCFLRARLLEVEFGPPPALPVPLPPEIVSMLESFVSTQLRALAPSGSVAMGLDALDLPTGFLNAGLTVDTSGSTLAIRVEIRASQDLRWAAWQNFHSGFIVDRRDGRDWALFVPAAYIEHRITSELWRALPRDDDLEAYPGASYVPLPGRARFDVDVLLIYHAVEVDALDLDVTVAADPKVQLSIWVDQRNRLSAEIDFAGLVNPVGALSTLAVSLVDAFGIPARAMLYRFVGSAIVDELAGQPVTSVTQPTATTVRIDKDITSPSLAGVAGAIVTDLLAHADGIALAGEFTVSEPSNAIVEILGVSPFAKHVPNISCGAATIALVALFGQSPGVFGILRAGVGLGNRGTAPLHLCGLPQLQRLDGPVQPRNIHVDEVGLPIDVSIDIGLPTQQYYDAPFPIELIVRTNGGTRLFRFDPPPVVTPEELDRMQAELLVKIGDCQQLVDPWFKGHSGYNPRWSPRPPDDFAELLHHWEVVVSGLPADERVELRGPDGVALASAPGAGPAASVSVAVVVQPVAEGREVGIVRIGDVHAAPAEVPEGSAQGLEIRQTDLLVLGEVPLAEPTFGIGLVELPSGPAVLALLSGRVEALDVRSGAGAGSVASWPGRFQGVLRSTEGTLLYGADGVSRLDALGRLTPTVVQEPVMDAARGADGVYLVTGDSVLRFSRDLATVTRSDRPEVRSVGSVGPTVLLAHGAGTDEADGALNIRRAGGRDGSLPAAWGLERAASLRRQGALATWDDGSVGLLQDRGGTVAEVARFGSRPLLAGAVRIGDRLVIRSERGDRLRVIGIGRRVVL